MTKRLSHGAASILIFCTDAGNARLVILSGIQGPVWVMDVYLNNTTHWVVYEEISKKSYYTTEELRPRDFIPEIDGTTFEREIVHKKRTITQQGSIYTNSGMEICLKWTNVK